MRIHILEQLAEQEERLKREEEELLKLRKSRAHNSVKAESLKSKSKSEVDVPWTGGGDNSEWNV